MKVIVNKYPDKFTVELIPETVVETVTLLQLTSRSKIEAPEIIFDMEDGTTHLGFRKAQTSKYNAGWIEGGRK